MLVILFPGAYVSHHAQQACSLQCVLENFLHRNINQTFLELLPCWQYWNVGGFQLSRGSIIPKIFSAPPTRDDDCLYVPIVTHFRILFLLDESSCTTKDASCLPYGAECRDFVLLSFLFAELTVTSPIVHLRSS